MNAGNANNLQVYRDAAEELNDLLGLDPPIDTDADSKELFAKIGEAAILLERGDQPTESTILALNKLNAIPKGWKLVKPKHKAPKPEEPTTIRQMTKAMRRVAPPFAMIRELGFLRAAILQEFIDLEDLYRRGNTLTEDGRFYYQKSRLAALFGVSESAIEKALAGQREIKRGGKVVVPKMDGLRDLGFIDWELRWQGWEIGGKWRRYRKGQLAYYKLDHKRIGAFLIKLKQQEDAE